MSWEILFIFGLLVFAIISFVTEKLPIDVTAFLIFSAVVLVGTLSGSTSLPTFNEALQVFTNPAPLTIAGMFIISAALERNGALELIAHALKNLPLLGYRSFMLLFVLGVALASAFTNNTPVVVIFLPIVLGLSRQMKIPASKLLIPLSYASIFGGTCTLVGTSTNILMSGILKTNDQPLLGMFELSVIGVPLLFIGTGYLILFGKKILPLRETLISILSEEERKEYITEAYVRKDSKLIGQTLHGSGLLKHHGIRVLEIIRNGIALDVDSTHLPLQESDRIILACRPSGAIEAHHLKGISLPGEMGESLETITADEGAVVEGIIGPTSNLIGKTIREINFRQRYRMILLAIHRKGKNVREKLETLTFEFGDTLLMMGTDMAIQKLRTHHDIILLDHPPLLARSKRGKIPIVVGVIVAIITTVSFHLLPIAAAVLTGITILFITGCINPKDGYAAIEWRLLVLIYGMLSLGIALEKSGAGSLISETLSRISDNPYLILAIIYLATSLLTEFMSNNATVVLMAPIALQIAATVGVDPRPFIIIICIAASASFSTPIGYQTNTYVYGVGGYRFSDFIKVGVPLDLLYFIGSLVLIPQFFPF